MSLSCAVLGTSDTIDVALSRGTARAAMIRISEERTCNDPAQCGYLLLHCGAGTMATMPLLSTWYDRFGRQHRVEQQQAPQKIGGGGGGLQHASSMRLNHPPIAPSSVSTASSTYEPHRHWLPPLHEQSMTMLLLDPSPLAFSELVVFLITMLVPDLQKANIQQQAKIQQQQQQQQQQVAGSGRASALPTAPSSVAGNAEDSSSLQQRTLYVLGPKAVLDAAEEFVERELESCVSSAAWDDVIRTWESQRQHAQLPSSLSNGFPLTLRDWVEQTCVFVEIELDTLTPLSHVLPEPPEPPLDASMSPKAAVGGGGVGALDSLFLDDAAETSSVVSHRPPPSTTTGTLHTQAQHNSWRNNWAIAIFQEHGEAPLSSELLLDGVHSASTTEAPPYPQADGEGRRGVTYLAALVHSRDGTMDTCVVFGLRHEMGFLQNYATTTQEAMMVRLLQQQQQQQAPPWASGSLARRAPPPPSTVYHSHLNRYTALRALLQSAQHLSPLLVILDGSARKLKGSEARISSSSDSNSKQQDPASYRNPSNLLSGGSRLTFDDSVLDPSIVFLSPLTSRMERRLDRGDAFTSKSHGKLWLDKWLEKQPAVKRGGGRAPVALEQRPDWVDVVERNEAEIAAQEAFLDAHAHSLRTTLPRNVDWGKKRTSMLQKPPESFVARLSQSNVSPPRTRQGANRLPSQASLLLSEKRRVSLGGPPSTASFSSIEPVRVYCYYAPCTPGRNVVPDLRDAKEVVVVDITSEVSRYLNRLEVGMLLPVAADPSANSETVVDVRAQLLHAVQVDAMKQIRLSLVWALYEVGGIPFPLLRLLPSSPSSSSFLSNANAETEQYDDEEDKKKFQVELEAALEGFLEKNVVAFLGMQSEDVINSVPQLLGERRIVANWKRM